MPAADNRFELPTSGRGVSSDASQNAGSAETMNKFGTNIGSSKFDQTNTTNGTNNSVTDTFSKALAETIAKMQFSKNTNTTTTTAPSFIKETGTVTNNKNIDISNMPPEALAALLSTIGTLKAGGTKLQQENIAKKAQTQQLIESLLGNFTTSSAMKDADALVALVNQQNAERDRPQIQKAIEGAGASGAAMQGLLAQNASRNAALAAGALGAEQAKAYGGITAQLTSQLAQLVNNTDDPVTTALLQALGIAKGSMTKGSETNTTVNDLLKYISGTSSSTNTTESGDQITNTTGTTTTTGKNTTTGTTSETGKVSGTKNTSDISTDSINKTSSPLSFSPGSSNSGRTSSVSISPNASWAGNEAPSQQLISTADAIGGARRADGSIDWTKAAASLYPV